MTVFLRALPHTTLAINNTGFIMYPCFPKDRQAATHRNQFDKTECRDVLRQDFLVAFRSVLLAPRGPARSENSGTLKAKLETRCGLNRKG